MGYFGFGGIDCRVSYRSLRMSGFTSTKQGIDNEALLSTSHQLIRSLSVIC